MSTDKNKAIASGDVTNQQAIVSRVVKKGIQKQKIVIPGGSKLLENITAENAQDAIYTWLRGCKAFTAVTLSLCQDLAKIQVARTKVQDFPNNLNTNAEPWTVHAEGKKWLARLLAEQMLRKKFVALEIQKDGLYILTDPSGQFGPDSDIWQPYIEFTPKDTGEYKIIPGIS